MSWSWGVLLRRVARLLAQIAEKNAIAHLAIDSQATNKKSLLKTCSFPALEVYCRGAKAQKCGEEKNGLLRHKGLYKSNTLQDEISILGSLKTMMRKPKSNTILLETKGDDRDNSDNEAKNRLGREWATQAGKYHRHFYGI